MVPADTTKKTESTEPNVTPKNAIQVKKAVTLGREMMKKGDDVTKADVARAMYELIHTESREVIVQAFVDGANLTPKGAQTYFYNCRRRMKKGS